MLPILLAVVAIAVSVFLFMKMSAGKRVALNPAQFKKFVLAKRIEVSHDTYIFRFALDDESQTLGLPIGQHIAIRAECTSADGTKKEMVQHSYTPISCDEDKGFVDFMIKVYFANVNPKFPGGGRLSQRMHQLKVGDTIEMRGPHGKFDYKGNGDFLVQKPGQGWVPHHVDAFACVAGGTGITPILQVMRAIHRQRATDKTKVFLVFGNRSVDDILLRKELDEMQKENPDQFHVWYTIDVDAPADWQYGQGYVTEEMLRAHLCVPAHFGDDTVKQNKGIKSALALMCGPPPMVQYAMKPNLEKLGYKAEDMFSF